MFGYRRSATDRLRRVLDDEPDMVFEAHSTDYQSAASHGELVAGHWAVLKVGPGLTDRASRPAAVVERRMPEVLLCVRCVGQSTLVRAAHTGSNAQKLRAVARFTPRRARPPAGCP
ncbi:class II D-tagatose-bisphosphate aldolase non-catalytic subunit [Streptomyces sp. NPDC048568]|uniref:class II D-tagatose-bisphosphate aldolase non-catalytic subunit n=1 Tax=Streptomyces sp. NPDC048568 TaxID=3365571 RepID=UPI00371599B7